ncbi:MAG: discoidin domain-containing protein [candidate division Zixibacteria bacterium]|nr:discoidin domain-containing protein [candidate division Zixibacteria bacterium]
MRIRRLTSSRTGGGKEREVTASSSLEWVWGLNTGFDPKSSADIDKNYFYFWESEHPEKWVQYDFKAPVTLSESKVYWLNLDHYDGNYRSPEYWSLMVKDSRGNWADVVKTDPYGVALDKYNTVTFQPAKTSVVRMKVKPQKGNSAGMLAWRVN